MNKLLKAASFLLYLLSVFVFFFAGMAYAGVSGAGQGLAGGAVVFMHVVAFGRAALFVRYSLLS